jgi:hypothetical protein
MRGNRASRTAGATTATIARRGRCGCAVRALVTVARRVHCLFNACDARLSPAREASLLLRRSPFALTTPPSRNTPPFQFASWSGKRVDWCTSCLRRLGLARGATLVLGPSVCGGLGSSLSPCAGVPEYPHRPRKLAVRAARRHGISWVDDEQSGTGGFNTPAETRG